MNTPDFGILALIIAIGSLGLLVLASKLSPPRLVKNLDSKLNVIAVVITIASTLLALLSNTRLYDQGSTSTLTPTYIPPVASTPPPTFETATYTPDVTSIPTNSLYPTLEITVTISVLETEDIITPSLDSTVQIELFSDSRTLVLYIPSKMSLTGLKFATIDSNGGLSSYSLAKAFPILNFTNGLAEPGSCFIYRLASTASPLPNVCQSDRVFLQEFPRSDIFWYDTLLNQPKDIAIYNDNQYIAICSATVAQCTVSYGNFSEQATPTVTSVPSPTSIDTISYPCLGIISTTSTGSLLNVVYSLPDITASLLEPVQVGQQITIFAKLVTGTSTWYQISYGANQRQGWVLTKYVAPSKSCPE